MKLTIAEMTDELRNFYGSHQWHRYSILFPTLLTDGVKWLADNAGENGCYWLLDKISSLQLHPKLRRNKKLQEPGVSQFWKLTVFTNNTAILVCENGNGKVAYSEIITYTDFQLPEIKLWYDPKSKVLMLPTEN